MVKRLLNGSYYLFDLPFHMLCVGALTQRQMIMCLLDSKLEANIKDEIPLYSIVVIDPPVIHIHIETCLVTGYKRMPKLDMHPKCPILGA